MKTLKECESIEEKIEYIKNTDPVELAGEIMGMESVIIAQEKRIEKLRTKMWRNSIKE